MMISDEHSKGRAYGLWGMHRCEPSSVWAGHRSPLPRTPSVLTSHILDPRLEWEWALHVALPSLGGRHAYTAANAAAAQLARVALDHDTREDHDDPGLLDLASSDSDIQLPTFATCHRAHKRAMVQ